MNKLNGKYIIWFWEKKFLFSSLWQNFDYQKLVRIDI